MRAVLFFIPLLVLVNACTLSQTRPGFSARQTNALLREQSTLIDQQAQRLDAIAGAQHTLLTHLSEMQTQISAINSKVSSGASKTTGSGKERLGAQIHSIQSESGVHSGKALNIDDKAILGRVEYVWLDGANHYLKARIDTGAKSSSLSATNVQRFERNGDRWVRFDVALYDDQPPVTLEAPLLRHVKIRQASVDELERRAVVKLSVRLGEIHEETEFTLSDRNEMLYSVLLGRSFLRDIAVVDVAKKFTRSRDPKLTAQVAP